MSHIHVANSGRTPSADGSQGSLEHDHRPARLVAASDNRGRKQQVVNQLLDAYEKDRQLVAYEIHDGVVQCLTGALINLEASVRMLGDEAPAAARAGLDRTAELLHHGILEARTLMSGLRPEILEDHGLIAAVEHLVRQSRSNTQAIIELSWRGDFGHLSSPLETTLLRIVQESLANALRHSGSNKVRIALIQEDQRIRVSVEDWGIGFDPRKIAQNRFGVQGICQRARVFGGKAAIESDPGKGTRIVVDLPSVETWK